MSEVRLPDGRVMREGKCEGCGAAGEWLLEGKCSECWERGVGLDAWLERFEFDGMGALAQYRAEVDEALAELGPVISEPVACAVSAMREWLFALEDVVRYREELRGLPVPSWKPRAKGDGSE